VNLSFAGNPDRYSFAGLEHGSFVLFLLIWR
jgi:hypothetical protein